MATKNKQNRSEAKTPQKSISKFNFSSKRGTEQTITKELLSPFVDSFLMNMPSVTPLKRQVQFLLSPSPIKKDLFSQLLGSQIKQNSPGCIHGSNISILEQQDYDCVSSETIKQDEQESEASFSSDNQQGGWDEENGIRKRKRKSTAQIRMLKQQLDGQMNWTKQKIVRMAEVTGLSQSQVYKWCWDQKKKTIKHRDNRRRFIKKQYNLNKDYQRFQKDDKNEEQQIYDMQKELYTKPKMTYMRLPQQANADTQKKISKKLIFN